MKASAFIAARLRFKGKTAMVSIAVSFFIIIMAVSISSGFRKEIRKGVSTISGDIQVTSYDMNFISGESSISANPPGLEDVKSLSGIKDVIPAVYRAGIIRNGDDIQGVIFKGVPQTDSSWSSSISIPTVLSDRLGLNAGDDVTAYFIGERVRARKFHVKSVYKPLVDADDNILVYASISDMQRLNSWENDEVSALEIHLQDAMKSTRIMRNKSSEAGSILLMSAGVYDDTLVTTSIDRKYPQLFDWLNLIDFNVLVILILMTVVAGFNMISGLLILLFQNISTIGILKSMGMNDRAISEVFLRVSSNLVLKGMFVGNLFSLLFCLVQGYTHWITLNPENYFISYVPVHVNIPMILLADLAAYLVIMVFLLIPTLFVSRIDPAQTVRTQ